MKRSEVLRRECYVYALLDTRFPGKHRYGRWVFEALPFYIGKGTHTKRAESHLLPSAKDAGNTFKLRKIRSIRRDGFEPIICVKRKNLSESDAFDLERELIAKVGRSNLGDGPLTNLTDGGEGHLGAATSKQLRRLRKQTAEEWHASLSGAERKQRRIRIVEGIEAMSDEVREGMRAKQRQAHAKRTASERTKRSQKISQTTKAGLAALSNRKRKAMAKGTSSGLRLWYASMSDSERQAIVAARLKKAWATRRANG